MRKKFVTAILALISLGSFAVLGSSPDFVGRLVESLQQNAITDLFLPPSQLEDKPGKMGISKRVSPKYVSEPMERPEYALWHVVFDFSKKIKAKAEELNQQGQEGSLYGDYFIRQGPLSATNDSVLREIAARYFEEIDPLDKKAKNIIEEAKAEKTTSNPYETQFLPKHKAELRDLQTQKNEVALRQRDAVRSALGDEAFDKFSLFLKTDFTAGSTFQKITTPAQPEGFFYDPFSWVLWDDRQPPIIGGYSELYFFYFEGGSYNPSLDSLLLNWTTQTPLDLGRGDGYRDFFPARYFHPFFYSNWKGLMKRDRKIS